MTTTSNRSPEPLSGAQVGLEMNMRAEDAGPSSAGRYDFLLGRDDNTVADRASAGAITDAFPTAGLAARANLEFARNAADRLVDAGIGQFIDIGCGIQPPPHVTGPHIHNAVHWKNHHAPVVYVDNDPAVVALSRTRVTGRPGRGQITVLDGDLRDSGDLIAQAVEASGLDPRRPIGVLLTAVVHYLSADDQPVQRVQDLIAALPARSGIAISHLSPDLLPEGLHTHLPGVIAASGIPIYPRTLGEISRFFAGLNLVDPGIIPVHRWRNRPYERPRFDLLPDTAVGLYCGIARKPG
ncbi:SAM-dependent methyltransferase [Actinoplanes sp. HUAS TT8]|uniref:SAM-dependent methyltransferase n=1 Tax=Actinoplanes sp. HUAS TT8 TaxID=3447453 RepID=UPI003F5215F8